MHFVHIVAPKSPEKFYAGGWETADGTYGQWNLKANALATGFRSKAFFSLYCPIVDLNLFYFFKQDYKIEISPG